jgi:hypothetical protein
MSPAPQRTPEEAFALMQTWYQQQQQLAELKTAEVLARKELAAFYFPDPVEGSKNRLPLGDGFELRMTHGINRNVDEAALNNVTAAAVKKHKLNLDELFPMKPTLSLSAYRELSDAQRAFVDSLLDISPGTPKLQIVPANAADDEGGAAAAQPAQDMNQYHVVEDVEEASVGSFYRDPDGNLWELVEVEAADGAGVELQWAEADALVAEAVQRQIDGAAAPAAPAKRTRRRRNAAAE